MFSCPTCYPNLEQLLRDELIPDGQAYSIVPLRDTDVPPLRYLNHKTADIGSWRIPLSSPEYYERAIRPTIPLEIRAATSSSSSLPIVTRVEIEDIEEIQEDQLPMDVSRLKSHWNPDLQLLLHKLIKAHQVAVPPYNTMTRVCFDWINSYVRSLVAHSHPRAKVWVNMDNQDQIHFTATLHMAQPGTLVKSYNKKPPEPHMRNIDELDTMYHSTHPSLLPKIFDRGLQGTLTMDSVELHNVFNAAPGLVAMCWRPEDALSYPKENSILHIPTKSNLRAG